MGFLDGFRFGRSLFEAAMADPEAAAGVPARFDDPANRAPSGTIGHHAPGSFSQL